MGLNKSEWDLVSTAAANRRQYERSQQQVAYRLLEALSNNDLPMMKKLLSQGASIDNPLQKTGDTSHPLAMNMFPINYPYNSINPLGWAAYTDNVDALDLVLTMGADLSFPGPGGRDALWLAMVSSSIHTWDALMDYHQAQQISIPWGLRTNDATRATRLIEGVQRSNLTAVRDMISHVDVSQVDNTGRTALHWNLLQDPYTPDDESIGKLLIEYGAPVRQSDHEGVVPAALAVTPAQQALMDHAELAALSEQAHARAAAQREHLQAMEPAPETPDPTEPSFPQIQRPVRFKKPLM